MNDRQLIESFLDRLRLESREDLAVWINDFSEGYECDHYYGFTHDKDTGKYHLETVEEVEERRRKNRERWEALERGEGTTLGLLIHKTLKSYIPHMSSALFSSKPLLYHFIELDNQEAEDG